MKFSATICLKIDYLIQLEVSRITCFNNIKYSIILTNNINTGHCLPRSVKCARHFSGIPIGIAPLLIDEESISES